MHLTTQPVKRPIKFFVLISKAGESRGRAPGQASDYALRPFSTSTVSQRNVAYSIVTISLVLLECSRNNDIRYVSLRYGRSGKRPLRAPNPLDNSAMTRCFIKISGPPNHSGPQVFCPPLSPALLIRTTNQMFS